MLGCCDLEYVGGNISSCTSLGNTFILSDSIGTALKWDGNSAGVSGSYRNWWRICARSIFNSLWLSCHYISSFTFCFVESTRERVCFLQDVSFLLALFAFCRASRLAGGAKMIECSHGYCMTVSPWWSSLLTRYMCKIQVVQNILRWYFPPGSPRVSLGPSFYICCYCWK